MAPLEDGDLLAGEALGLRDAGLAPQVLAARDRGPPSARALHAEAPAAARLARDRRGDGRGLAEEERLREGLRRRLGAAPPPEVRPRGRGDRPRLALGEDRPPDPLARQERPRRAPRLHEGLVRPGRRGAAVPREGSGAASSAPRGRSRSSGAPTGSSRSSSPGGTRRSTSVLSTIAIPELLKIAVDLPDETRSAWSAIRYAHALCPLLELDRPFHPYYWTNVADETMPFGGVIEHTNFIPRERYAREAPRLPLGLRPPRRPEVADARRAALGDLPAGAGRGSTPASRAAGSRRRSSAAPSTRSRSSRRTTRSSSPR